MVSRSALNRAQTSWDSSSMISSTLAVAWILLVTACRFLKNVSGLPTSERAPGSRGVVVRMAAFMLPPPGRPKEAASQQTGAGAAREPKSPPFLVKRGRGGRGRSCRLLGGEIGLQATREQIGPDAALAKQEGRGRATP